MNRIFHPSANTILFRLSDNAEHYKGGPGKFSVTFHSNKAKTFTSLLEAFLYYIAIDDEAELWDVSRSKVLVEKKVKMCLN